MRVGGELLGSPISEDVLISKQLTDGGLFDRHALLVSIVHGFLLVNVTILEGEFLSLMDFG